MNPKELREQCTFLDETPRKLSRILKRLDEQPCRTKLSDDEFSVLEHICHLRDIEIDGYEVRFMRILKEDHPRLSDIDGGRLALERRYNEQVITDALESFKDARSRNLSTLSQLSAEDMAHTGELEGVGDVNVADLVRMLCEHDESHLDELETLERRLRARSAEQ